MFWKIQKRRLPQNIVASRFAVVWVLKTQTPPFPNPAPGWIAHSSEDLCLDLRLSPCKSLVLSDRQLVPYYALIKTRAQQPLLAGEDPRPSAVLHLEGDRLKDTVHLRRSGAFGGSYRATDHVWCRARLGRTTGRAAQKGGLGLLRVSKGWDQHVSVCAFSLQRPPWIFFSMQMTISTCSSAGSALTLQQRLRSSGLGETSKPTVQNPGSCAP